MATYYIIDRNTRELKRTSKTPFNIDPDVQPPDPYIQLLRVDDDTQPPFAPATEKLERFVTDDDITFTRTFAFRVIAQTPEEQAEYQQRQADAAVLEQIKTIYQDMKNGVGTAPERLVRVEKACAWLLRAHVRESLR